MQTQKSKIDTGKALDADLVDTESIRTDSTVQDDSSRSSLEPQSDDFDQNGFKLTPKYNKVHQAAETVTTSNELDLLFGPLFDEYFNGENQVVLKSSAVTTTDASNKRQQQPDSTSSTSTLATTALANGNFNLTSESYSSIHSEEGNPA
ncbi:hypothetical protein Tco_0861906 [Tanacetum coccineum]